jgi:hypothetical protein
VPGWQVEYLVGPDDHLLAFVGPDAHPSPEDHTAVIQLARGGADLRLGVCLPAPAWLQDMTGDHRSGQAHLMARTKRIGHHRLGLAEVADLDRAHGDPPRRDSEPPCITSRP